MSTPADQDEMCAALAGKLAGVVDNTVEVSAEERAHIEHCLKCQAEIVGYKKLLRAMHNLRTQVVQPAPGLLAAVLDRVGERAEQRAVRSVVTNKRIAYGSAIFLAAGAGVTGAVLIVGRGRAGRSKGKKAA